MPWARSATPGAADGGNKFDLAQWDPAYFERLRGFVADAAARGIVVEVVLFSSYYGDGWPGSPLNAANNVNAVGAIPKAKANTLDNGNLLAEQEKTVRKIVEALAAFDNVYYEIQNEPWADHEAPAAVVSFSILPQDMDATLGLLEESRRPRHARVARLAGEDRLCRGRDGRAPRHAPSAGAELLQPSLSAARRL